MAIRRAAFALLAATATAHWVSDLQELRLADADPCVRLLSTAGPVGCTTPRDGSVAQLRAILTHEDLQRELAAAPALRASGKPVAIALSADLFDVGVLRTLRRVLGSRLQGVAVLAASPAAAEPAWDGAGSGLSQEAFDFGIVLLNVSESAAALRSVSAAGTPLLQLKYPMQAQSDSFSCLAAGT